MMLTGLGVVSLGILRLLVSQIGDLAVANPILLHSCAVLVSAGQHCSHI